MAVYADMLTVMAKVERADVIALVAKKFAGELLSDAGDEQFNEVIEEFNRTHLKLMVFGSPSVIAAVSEFYGDEMLPMEGEKKS